MASCLVAGCIFPSTGHQLIIEFYLIVVTERLSTELVGFTGAGYHYARTITERRGLTAFRRYRDIIIDGI